MTRPALKIAPQPLSPERDALAVAIAEAAPLRAIADEARAKAEAARGALSLALAAVPVAERAAEEAKAHIIDNPHAERATLRAKRQVVTDAADDLAIAREISARADAAEVEADRSDRYAMERVEAAAAAVMVGAFPAAIEAAERAAREAASLAFVAKWLGSHGNPFNGERNSLMLRAEVLNPHIAFGRDGNAALASELAAVGPWKDAISALLSDPSAPLPAL